MNDWLIDGLSRDSLPPDFIGALHRVALSPPEVATQAWYWWLAQDRLMTMTWQEQRLLARILPRLRDLVPNDDAIEFIAGLTRSEWVRTQVTLKKSLPALDILLESGFEVMLFKGSAIEAVSSGYGPRLSADLDLVVREEHFHEAFATLREQGWRSKYYDLDAKYEKATLNLVQGINLTHEEGGDVDLHRRFIHAPLSREYMQQAWGRSAPLEFKGRRVRCISREDALITIIAGAFGWSAGEHLSSLWLTDCAGLLEAEDSIDIPTLQQCLQDSRQLIPFELAMRYGSNMIDSQIFARLRKDVGALDISLFDLWYALQNHHSAFRAWSVKWLVFGTIRRLRVYRQQYLSRG